MARRLAPTYHAEPRSALALWSRHFALFALVVALFAIIVVRFGSGGERKLMAEYAPLTKL